MRPPCLVVTCLIACLCHEGVRCLTFSRQTSFLPLPFACLRACLRRWVRRFCCAAMQMIRLLGLIAGAKVFLAPDELIPAAKQHETAFGMVPGMGVLVLSLLLSR